MPAWAELQGGGRVPTPLRPPQLGLVLWVEGDTGLTEAAGRVSAWTDQSPVGQDLVQAVANDRPFDNGDTIDGVPAIEFGTGIFADKIIGTAGSLVDRDSVPMDNSHARTFIVVTKPKYYLDYDRIGGPIGDFGDFQAGFELWSGVTPNAAYAWANGWLTSNLQFGPVTGGAGSAYNDVPTLIQWKSAGFPQIDFLVNNIATALTPSTQQGTPGGAHKFTLGSQVGLPSYLGAVAAAYIWDHSTTADEDSRMLTYLRGRFPSLVI